MKDKIKEEEKWIENFLEKASTDIKEDSLIDVDRRVNSLSLLLEILGEEPTEYEVELVRKLKDKLERGYL